MDQQGQYDSEEEMNEHHEFLFKEACKKLSSTQQKVVNMLMVNDGSYIHESSFYNHHRVVSKEPFIHEYGFETRELMQFSRPTLNVLIKKGIILCSNENKRIYTLNN